MQQLRSYPSNFFVHAIEEQDLEYRTREHKDNKTGLVVCNHLGEEQGFIETGGEEGIVIQ